MNLPRKPLPPHTTSFLFTGCDIVSKGGCSRYIAIAVTLSLFTVRRIDFSIGFGRELGSIPGLRRHGDKAERRKWETFDSLNQKYRVFPVNSTISPHLTVSNLYLRS